MSLLTHLFGQSENSAAMARERLHVVLAHDRMNIPPATLDLMKDEIISAISNHVEIDRAHVEVDVARGPRGNRLMMNIPVLGLRHTTPSPAPRAARARKPR